MVNTPSNGREHEDEQPASPTIRSAQEQYFNGKGIEVLACDTGIVGRPMVSGDNAKEIERGFGKRKYFALSDAQQERLHIGKPSDAVIAIVGPDGSIDLYLGAGLVPDEDFEPAPGKKMQDGFISRAEKGLYADHGIRNAEEARARARQYPISDQTIAAPFFKDAGGSSIDFAVIDQQRMKGRYIPTTLATRSIDGGYPERLLEKWNRIDKQGAPLLVVPNAVAKLAGLSMTSTKLQPGNLGNTIADGDFCDVQLPDGSDVRAFVVGALDSVGIPAELASSFEIGSPYDVKICVGGGKLILKKADLTKKM